MLNDLFKGIFDASTASVISAGDFLLCICVSLVLGLLLALAYMFRTRYTKSFVATLAMLPAVVCVVIMMVNGNVGTGVAVAGAFSLVRFRSAPGTAKEIGALFIAMGIGLIAGMGYLAYAVLFTVLLGGVMMGYSCIDFGARGADAKYKTLSITIPENLNYTQVFDDIFEEFTTSHELVRVRTSNMGSLYKLTYDITLRDIQAEKQMLDKLRCRNGNLEISLSAQENGTASL